MREQEKKLKALFVEYKELKTELFKDCPFREMTNCTKEKRYCQLLGFFYPHYRTKGWINPLKELGTSATIINKTFINL